MTTPKRPGSRTVAASVGAVVVAGILVAPRGPPLYDGIGFPDEPYRYAQVLATDPVKTPPPTVASATLKLEGSANVQGIELTTGEVGPQLLAFIPQRAIATTAAAATVVIAATPLAPDLPRPGDGPVAGDIYRLATAAPATWRPGTAGTISLRSPQGIPVTPTLEFRRAGAGGWQRLPTTRVGTDIWESPLHDLGDYALVLAAPKAAPGKTGSTVVYLLAAGIAAIAAVLIGVRLALRRRQDPGT